MGNYEVEFSQLWDAALSLGIDVWEESPQSFAPGSTGDLYLRPASLTNRNRVSQSNRRVRVLCNTNLANGDETVSWATTEGGGNQPLRCPDIRWKGEFFPIVVEPTVKHARDASGPLAFCREYGLTPEQTFPIRIIARAKFECPPTQRGLILYHDGSYVQIEDGKFRIEQDQSWRFRESSVDNHYVFNMVSIQFPHLDPKVVKHEFRGTILDLTIPTEDDLSSVMDFLVNDLGD